MKYLTTPLMLNLRKEPRVVSTNILAVLPELTLVEKLEASTENPKWWKVKAHYFNDSIEGYLNSSYLKEEDEKTDFKTTPDALNLRKNPYIAGNIITQLPKGTPVKKLNEYDDTWWEVRTKLQNKYLEGFVHKAYLEADETQEPVYDKYKTTADFLNFRSQSKVAAGNIIAVLSKGTVVEKRGEAGDNWWEVQTLVSGRMEIGYVSKVYLDSTEGEEPIVYEEYKTTPAFLNFRKQPKVTAGNVIAELKKGTVVEKLEETDGTWWKVQTPVSGKTEIGYVSKAYLEKVGPADPEYYSDIPPVHLETTGAVTRNNERWPFSLNENNMPFRTSGGESAKKADIKRIIDFLDVEHSNRYRPRSSYTYCNIYAYDYCYLNKVYLPRVWWSPKAISRILNGETLIPIYANTVFEINANSLYGWLRDYGPGFGWTRVYTLDEIQNAANKGKIGIICAPNKNPGRSGHICAVVPETTTHKCTRYTDGRVRFPLQSQAGASNKKYFANNNWWLNTNSFTQFGFWIHD